MEFDNNLNPVQPSSEPTPPKAPTWVPPQSFSPTSGSFGSKSTWKLPLIGLGVLGLLLMGALLAQQGGNPSSNSQSTGQPEGLNVSAEGVVYATPDIAKIYVGVHETGREASPIENELSTRINKIKDKLRELGVATEDIKTTDFNIYPEYNSYLPASTPTIRAYTGRHILEVTVRDLDRVNAIADAVIASGANEVQNISFTVEDPDTLLEEARTQAIQKAKDKAKQLADAADIRLGRLLSINEYPMSSPFDARMGYGGMGGAESDQVGLEPGNMEIRVNVTLIYAIR